MLKEEIDRVKGDNEERVLQAGGCFMQWLSGAFFTVGCSVQVTPEKYCKLVSEEGGLAIIGKN
jgi:hypothetical protein